MTRGMFTGTGGGVPPVSYERFRTGFTFTDIRRQLYDETKVRCAAGDYITVTRKRVLGRWGEIKRGMYEAYLEEMRDAAAAEIDDFVGSLTAA